jgi:hypothetical protein
MRQERQHRIRNSDFRDKVGIVNLLVALEDRKNCFGLTVYKGLL